MCVGHTKLHLAEVAAAAALLLLLLSTAGWLIVVLLSPVVAACAVLTFEGCASGQSSGSCALTVLLAARGFGRGSQVAAGFGPRCSS